MCDENPYKSPEHVDKPPARNAKYSLWERITDSEAWEMFITFWPIGVFTGFVTFLMWLIGDLPLPGVPVMWLMMTFVLGIVVMIASQFFP